MVDVLGSNFVGAFNRLIKLKMIVIIHLEQLTVNNGTGKHKTSTRPTSYIIGQSVPTSFTCEAIIQVVRWPRGAGSCFHLVNAP